MSIIIVHLLQAKVVVIATPIVETTSRWYHWCNQRNADDENSSWDHFSLRVTCVIFIYFMKLIIYPKK